MPKPEAPARAGPELGSRYTAADMGVLTAAEASRFVRPGRDDPHGDIELAWELLYRLEPELYDRLATAERLHPGVVGWLPRGLGRIAEVGAGSGRLTMELIERGQQIVAVEPALPLGRLLRGKLAAAGHPDRVQVIPGFFDQLPLRDSSADLVVTCSALTPAPEHGGEAGLAEMERVGRPGGLVVIVWPNHLDWLAAHGYRHVSFPGPMSVEFASQHEAAELAGIFYPQAAIEIRRRGLRTVPFEVLGINPPRDLAYKVLAL